MEEFPRRVGEHEEGLPVNSLKMASIGGHSKARRRGVAD
jgi:hypothetical protein